MRSRSDRLWNAYLERVFGHVGYAIKPPLGPLPGWAREAPVPLAERITYRVRYVWWALHCRVDRYLGRARQARWKAERDWPQ